MLRRRSLGPRRFLRADPERLCLLAGCGQLPCKRVGAFMRSSCRLILRDGFRTRLRRLGLERLELAPRRRQVVSQRLKPLALCNERRTLLRRRSLGPRRFLRADPERLCLLAGCGQLPRKRVRAFMRSSCRLILGGGGRAGLRCLRLERLELAPRRGQVASQPLSPRPERLGLLASCGQLPSDRVRAFMRGSCRLNLCHGSRSRSRRFELTPRRG